MFWGKTGILHTFYRKKWYAMQIMKKHLTYQILPEGSWVLSLTLLCKTVLSEDQCMFFNSLAISMNFCERSRPQGRLNQSEMYLKQIERYLKVRHLIKKWILSFFFFFSKSPSYNHIHCFSKFSHYKIRHSSFHLKCNHYY